MPKNDQIKSQIADEWIPAIYTAKVRSQRTRAVDLPVPARENRSEILYTLLGIELKVGKRRITCPDLATARYLRVFARIGCSSVAIPYDITRISPLADELETAWQRLLLLVELDSEGKSPAAASRLRGSIIREIRTTIDEIGAGSVMPEFRQSTRQRNN